MDVQARSGVQRRSGAIDALRVLGVLAVVAGHIVAGNGVVRDVLYAWHVPLFFLLSGYFWRSGRSMRTELSKRTETLLYPYIGWFVIISVPYLLAAAARRGAEFSAWFEALYGGIEATSPYTTFWFISVLFFSAVLFRALTPLPQWVQWLAAALGLLAGYAYGPLLAQTPYSFASAAPCLVFLLIGRSARGMVEKVNHKIPVGLTLAAAGGTLVAIGLSAPVDIKQGEWGTPLLSIGVAAAICFGLILLCEPIFTWLPAVASTGATALAATCLAAVLAHPFVSWTVQSLDLNKWLEFALVIGLSWGAGLLFRRTRLSVWVNGTRHHPPAAQASGTCAP